MTITRHPDDSTLMSFAAGSLPAALAAVVAAHLTLCARCHDEVATMELLGGSLLDALPGVAMAGPPQAPLPGVQRETRLAHRRAAASGEVPAPLARLIGDDLDAVRLRRVSRGLWLRWLPVDGGGRLHLFKGAPGATVSEHGHKGSELTLVLRGTISDHTGEYRAGDICDLDESIEHIQVAGPDGCFCVVAQEHPVRWRRLLVRLARPWHGM
jgi:putative transcriptional regulator